MSQWQHADVTELIALALREDIASGDITTNGCIDPDVTATGRYFARETAVLAGVELLPQIFAMRGGVESIEVLCNSGDNVTPGLAVAAVRGRARTLLECERTSLNFLQRLSGVATNARRFAELVAGTKCRVLDTRKTTPGWRRLEKAAAAAGGATNHRMGLYDAVLIKNNHIAAAGGVGAALEKFRNSGVPVEIEVRDHAELEQALAAGARHVLLDNRTPDEARAEIAWIADRATVELSGNITLETVRAYAETGTNFISAGAITHGARSVDFNFRVELDHA
ncbi:MAG TPA: carboxylating nicotinate-nucleotide diphosphorylase [Bryobacteraceae bacterium]|nr:carboxylating nicotinate-nucleotide diphosphorylase [Bryobacteraceae bacterium]